MNTLSINDMKKVSGAGYNNTSANDGGLIVKDLSINTHLFAEKPGYLDNIINCIFNKNDTNTPNSSFNIKSQMESEKCYGIV